MSLVLSFPAVDIAASDTLVLVHIIAIGWLSKCVCGALTQFVPVLVGKPWSEPRKLLQEWVESVTSEETDHEAKSVHGRADHRDFAGAGGGCGNG
ncbi:MULTISPECIES: hypothetical protein [Bradyrhizobium]|uniref:hypothetical protein n=1 Tax=Bradyrhizobium TaxID=374 RepID=UPI000ABEACB9|nr:MULTISPECIES: hypothetical protein [Bradyrhizobium]